MLEGSAHQGRRRQSPSRSNYSFQQAAARIEHGKVIPSSCPGAQFYTKHMLFHREADRWIASER